MNLVDIEKNKYTKLLSLVFDALKSSQVIAVPTDTIYGFSALASDKIAIKKIYNIKNRPEDKKFILLVSSLEMAKKYANIDNKQAKYLESVWPGPITVVLKVKDKYSFLGSKEGTIAIRYPNLDLLIDIINRVNEAIVSTSVNISSQDNLNKALDIENYFQDKKYKPDLIVKAKSGGYKSSRIVNIVDINNPIILRK